jgi:hypothetical protein
MTNLPTNDDDGLGTTSELRPLHQKDQKKDIKKGKKVKCEDKTQKAKINPSTLVTILTTTHAKGLGL